MDDEVTCWIKKLADGNKSAATPIWDRYYERLVNLACARLRNSRRREADEEDVAISAFQSFCAGVTAGRFPDLSNRDELWSLLVTITARKAVAQLRREYAQKRNREVGESAVTPPDASTDRAGLDWVTSDEPTPDAVVAFDEDFRRNLSLLGDDSLRQVVTKKLEGYNNLEIAEQLGCAPGTIQRRWNRIKEKWSREV
jgi:DNA-directed RNA polymerase specialized sigma24 family protein